MLSQLCTPYSFIYVHVCCRSNGVPCRWFAVRSINCLFIEVTERGIVENLLLLQCEDRLAVHFVATLRAVSSEGRWKKRLLSFFMQDVILVEVAEDIIG